MRQKHRVCAACTYLSKQQLAQVTTRLLTSRLPLVRLVGYSVDLIREIYLHRSLLLASSCYCARANSCMELRGGMGIEPSSIGSLDVDGSRRFFSPSKCVTFVRSILAVCAARARARACLAWRARRVVRTPQTQTPQTRVAALTHCTHLCRARSVFGQVSQAGRNTMPPASRQALAVQL